MIKNIVIKNYEKNKQKKTKRIPTTTTKKLEKA